MPCCSPRRRRACRRSGGGRRVGLSVDSIAVLPLSQYTGHASLGNWASDRFGGVNADIPDRSILHGSRVAIHGSRTVRMTEARFALLFGRTACRDRESQHQG